MSPTIRYVQFQQACLTDHALALELLAADPTLLDVRSGLGETPLHDLAVENALDAVRFLLAQGADPDPRNKFGNSPL